MKHQNLGRKIDRGQLKRIKGGGAMAAFNLTCDNASGTTFIASYTTLNDCFNARVSACNPALYDNCTCSGPGGNAMLCL